MASAVAEGESVVVVGWLGEVERAGGCVVAVAGGKEMGYIIGLSGDGTLVELQVRRRTGKAPYRKRDIIQEQDLVEPRVLFVKVQQWL